MTEICHRKLCRSACGETGGWIMAVKTTRFDSAQYLDSDEAISAYLEEALMTDDPAFIAQALGTVARARGMSRIAKETGLSRESLYKAGARAAVLRHGCGAALSGLHDIDTKGLLFTLMIDPIALTLSALALVISATTAWLTLFRRGTLKMTQPTVVFFGPDTPRSRDHPALPKVFLRTLLFSTSKRGRVIENMYVALSRNETHQNFNIWVYGDGDKLVKGSGLFVGETGVAANHHFLAPRDASSFRFIGGQYRIEVVRAFAWRSKSKASFFSDS
jgi:probable addiction module antidote protein